MAGITRKLGSRYKGSWLAAAVYAMAITLFMLGLFIYWFAVADRYRVFLYYHDMGPVAPDTSPFSVVTASRYWMSALVAAGAVMVLCVSANWFAGRFFKDYRPPAWWQVWVLCAAPLLIGLPLITMNANNPSLPATNATKVTLAAQVGLALALAPGRMAAERPPDLLLLTLDGVALMLLLTTAVGLERINRWLATGSYYFIAAMALSFMTSVALLLALTALRWWRSKTTPTLGELFLAGLCVAYLGMPLLHHVGFTDGYFYISDADNFFARSLGLQASIWLAALLLAAVVTWLRERLSARRAGAVSGSESYP